MRRCRTSMVWIALCSTCVCGAAESFSIRFAGAADGVKVGYFIAGAFGGAGGSVESTGKDDTVSIEPEYDGKRAKDLKAVVYARGCQFSLLSVDLSSDSKREATIECQPLATTMLRGRVSPAPVSAEALEVEISYLASWDHIFFGMMDGPVHVVVLGKVALDADGRFQLEIPDFSKDPVTTQKKDACIQLVVRGHTTLNIVEWLFPAAADLRCDANFLKILPDYRPEMLFNGRL